MEPKFEQFKAIENATEKTPQVKPEVHYEIDAVARKFLFGEEITEKDISDVEMIYSELQDLDRVLIVILDTHRSFGVISKEEFLITSAYFLVAHQIGPESGIIKKFFENASKEKDLFMERLFSVSIPENTRNVIFSAYSKIIEI